MCVERLSIVCPPTGEGEAAAADTHGPHLQGDEPSGGCENEAHPRTARCRLALPSQHRGPTLGRSMGQETVSLIITH